MHRRMTAALAAVTILVLGTGVVFAAHQYSDVPDSNIYHSDVDWLTDNGISNGYGDGTYGPNDFVTRGQMAAFFHRYDNNLGAPTPESGGAMVFVDRGDGPTPWAVYSAQLGADTGATAGGTFRFSCSAAQAPCKISIGAAVVSDQSTAVSVPAVYVVDEPLPSARTVLVGRPRLL